MSKENLNKYIVWGKVPIDVTLEIETEKKLSKAELLQEAEDRYINLDHFADGTVGAVDEDVSVNCDSEIKWYEVEEIEQ